MTLIEIAERARLGIIAEIEEGAKRLLLTPGLGNGVPRVVAALEQALTAYEALVRAHHTSSSAEYAFRDLPFAEKQSYESAKHLLGNAIAIYGGTA